VYLSHLRKRLRFQFRVWARLRFYLRQIALSFSLTFSPHTSSKLAVNLLRRRRREYACASVCLCVCHTGVRRSEFAVAYITCSGCVCVWNNVSYPLAAHLCVLERDGARPAALDASLSLHPSLSFNLICHSKRILSDLRRSLTQIHPGIGIKEMRGQVKERAREQDAHLRARNACVANYFAV